MVKVINHIGEAFILPVPTELTEKLSGESELKFEFVETEQNGKIVNAISKKWKITNIAGSSDERIYVVTIVQKESNSIYSKVSIVAKEKQIDDLKGSRIYDNISGSYTASSYFDIVFKGSGYQFQILDNVYALNWENGGDGDTRLETFKKGLQRYGLEFEFDSHTATFVLKQKVYRYADYYIKNGTNALDFKLEEDSNEFYTYARGFGDYDNNNRFQEAGLQMFFKHPLADVIGKYEAPPIKDGKIKDEKVLRKKLIDLVNNSLKTSLSLNFISLKEEFPKSIHKVGD